MKKLDNHYHEFLERACLMVGEMLETKPSIINMKKRLNLQEKKELFIQDSINKMFEVAGHSVSFNDIKDRKDEWFMEWSMTSEQNEEWRKWGISEIKKRFKFNKKMAEREMSMISLMWGLKFSNASVS